MLGVTKRWLLPIFRGWAPEAPHLSLLFPRGILNREVRVGGAAPEGRGEGGVKRRGEPVSHPELGWSLLEEPLPSRGNTMD